MRQNVVNVLFTSPSLVDTIATWEAHLKWLTSLPEEMAWKEDYVKEAQDVIARKRRGEHTD